MSMWHRSKTSLINNRTTGIWACVYGAVLFMKVPARPGSRRDICICFSVKVVFLFVFYIYMYNSVIAAAWRRKHVMK